MKDVIISHPRQEDNILLEGEYEFPVYITIGLEEHNDFYVRIEFIHLDEEKYKIAALLAKEEKALSITSDLIEREDYNIKHIVVREFTVKGEYEMMWECSSDENFSLELD
jgi:hypothetical protein